MKKVLITGKNSFIGKSVEKYLLKSKNEYLIDTVDMVDGAWKKYDFSKYDTVFHVAGIAHSEVGNATAEQKALYYKINTDLAYETAMKAKTEGVKQFIFMSSAIVFGASAPLGIKKIVSKSTPTSPENFYGDSKVQAEIKLETLRTENFKICIVRPPMIYGQGSKGNYPLLSKIAKKLPIFPKIENCRSMIYIENFAEFIRLMIENQEDGIFMPQNNEYVCTSNMVKEIARLNGRSIHLTKIFNPALRILGKKFEVVNKAFGNLAYDKESSAYKENYCVCNFIESIKRTECKNVQKKVLMIASVASMIEQFNMENIKLLLDLGFDVEVACNCKEGNTISDQQVKNLISSLSKNNVQTTNLPIPRKITDFKGIFKSVSQVRKMCAENKYTIVHCHSPIGSVVARIGSAKSRIKNGTYVIYTAHGFHFYKGAPNKNWAMFYPIEKICSKITDMLITINKEDYNFAQKHMNAKKVEYIPGVGIDTEKFKLKNYDNRLKRNEINIKNTDIVIFSVGELNDNKNHEVIIKALAQLHNNNICYVIAGKGDKEEYLLNLAKELKVNLKLLGYRTDIKELLNIADIFAFPSIREGLSVSLMEAMAAGLPCVVSNIRGNVDLIDGKGGILCAPNDIQEFTNALNELCENNALRRKMGEYNLSKIKNFDKNIVNEKMKEIYEAIN